MKSPTDKGFTGTWFVALGVLYDGRPYRRRATTYLFAARIAAFATRASDSGSLSGTVLLHATVHTLLHVPLTFFHVFLGCYQKISGGCLQLRVSGTVLRKLRTGDTLCIYLLITEKA